MISNLSDDFTQLELDFLEDIERFIAMVPHPLNSDESLYEMYSDWLFLIKNVVKNLVYDIRFLNGRFNYEDSVSCNGSTKGSEEST